MNKRLFVKTLLGTLALPGYSFAADAAYPSRTLRLIVTYPPGGASDLMGRIVAQKFGDVVGQTVIVENRPGAAGLLGTDYAAKQPADGYSFMLGNMGPTIINPLLSKVPYDMARDFTPVSLIATGPVVLVVNGNSPYRTLQELVAGAHAKPGTLNFGSGGTGSLAHLTGEMMNRAAGLRMQHVPYKGGIAALNDVIAGQLDMIAADVQPVLQHVKSGKLRALAVTSPKRFAALPDVPTFAESGMPDLVALNSWGIFVPAGVPKPELERFEAALQSTMADTDLVQRFDALGVETHRSSSQELQAFMQAESARYAKVIQEKGIRSE